MAVIPFTAVPLILYTLAAVLFYDPSVYVVEPGQVALHPFWSTAVISLTLVSGQPWSLTYADLMIVLGLVMLMMGILRAATSSDRSVLGNMVMVLVLCAYVVLFLTMEFAGTNVFFILTIIALIDTLAQVSVSMVASHSRMDAVPD